MGAEFSLAMRQATRDYSIAVSKIFNFSNIRRRIMVSFLFSVVVIGLLARSAYHHIHVPPSSSIFADPPLPQTPSPNVTHSLDVASCPGYTLSNLQHSENGLDAELVLAGAPCNAFGTDVTHLTIQVTYETGSRRVPEIGSGAEASTHFCANSQASCQYSRLCPPPLHGPKLDRSFQLSRVLGIIFGAVIRPRFQSCQHPLRLLDHPALRSARHTSIRHAPLIPSGSSSV